MPTIFRNFGLFNGINSELLEECWLEVSQDRINRIGNGRAPPADETVDLGGRTVIPGLIDAHVHAIVSFTATLNLAGVLSHRRQVRLNLRNCIRNGVTTVRDTGATSGLIRQVIRWVEKGTVIGPRIVRANSFLTAPGAMPEHIPTFPFPLKLLLGGQAVERLRTPEEVRDAVRRMVALGADWIKTGHTDKSIWLNRPDPPLLDDACFDALIDEARKHNRPVAMHQTRASGFRKAIQIGVNSMEHVPSAPLTKQDIDRAVEAGIPIVPTLRVMRDTLLPMAEAEWLQMQGRAYLCPEPLRQTQALFQRYQRGVPEETAQKEYWVDMAFQERALPVIMENVRRLRDAGATVGCGTDSGGGPFTVFGRFYDEIDNLIQTGLSPFEALRSATVVNARILGLEDQLGTVEPGKSADFAVVEGNPLIDPTALRRVKMVIKGGSIVHTEDGDLSSAEEQQ